MPLQAAGDWALIGDIDGENAGDNSGQSVSLSGDGERVAIGAVGNAGAGVGAGHTRVFRWVAAAGNWSQLGAAINGEAAGDDSGWSVSLSGDGERVAIGADMNSDGGTSAGHVRVYECCFRTRAPSLTQRAPA